MKTPMNKTRLAIGQAIALLQEYVKRKGAPKRASEALATILYPLAARAAENHAAKKGIR